MQVSAQVLSLLSQYQILALFAGSFFFGESVIIGAGILSAYGVWAPVTVLWVAFLGTMSSDTAWFFGGRYFFAQFQKWEMMQKVYERVIIMLERKASAKPFRILLVIKFLYGTRILTIIYLSLRRVAYRSFFIYNAIGSIVWLMVMISIGWLIGKGFSKVLPLLHAAQFYLLALLIVMLLVTMITKWLSKKLTKSAH